MDSLQLTEITRLYAALMLSLSDNTILQYDNVATARAVKTGIRRLIFQAYDLNNHIKGIKSYMVPSFFKWHANLETIL